MKQGRLYMILLCHLLIVSCTTIKELPKEWKADYRYSSIDRRLFKDRLIRFLDYSAYKNTVISSSEADSTVTYGIIFPQSFYKINNVEQEMQFGNASDTCSIHYNYLVKYLYSSNRSLLMDVLEKESYKKERQTTQKLEYFSCHGAITYRGKNGEIPFMFEETIEPNSKLSGQVIIDNDSLIIYPVSKDILHTFKATQGVQLKKDNTVYALLLKTNDISKNRIALIKRASLEEQLIVAAYFAVISWYY